MKTKKVSRERFFVLGILFSLLFIVLISRLAYLMIFNGYNYKLLASQQWSKTIEIAPKRGTILDRNGFELAISMNVYRVDADLNVLNKYLVDKKIPEEQAVEQLSKMLNVENKEVKKILDSKDSKGNPLQFVSLKRKVEKNVVDSIKALKYKGIIITSDPDFRDGPNPHTLNEESTD